MSEGVRLAFGFLGFALVFLTAISLFFPEQVGQKIGQITKLNVSSKGLNADFDAAAKNYREAEKGSGDTPGDAELRARLEAAAGNARLMWVDDNPANNRAIIELLANLGYRVDIARDNREAVKYYSLATYDLIISDIARDQPGEQGTIGLQLPDRLKTVRGSLPALIFYVSRAGEPLTPDGYPVVNRPGELLRLIHVALKLETPDALLRYWKQ